MTRPSETQDRAEQDQQGSRTAQKQVREYQNAESTALKIDNVEGVQKKYPTSDILFGPEKNSAIHQLVLRVARLERLAENKLGVMEYSTYAAPEPPELVSNSNPDSNIFRCVFKPVVGTKTLRQGIAIDVNHYNIYRSNQTTNPWIAQRIAIIAQPSDTKEYLTFEDTIDDAQSYYYFLSSVNRAGIESARVLARKQASDAMAPGAVVDFTVTGAGGIFLATWKAPLTNVNTLDDFVIQYATNNTFTTGKVTVRVGRVFSKQGTDNEKTYFWRIAAHNKSGDTVTNTDSDLTSYLPNGWGPWTNYGSPTSVYSGSNLPIVIGNAPSGEGILIDSTSIKGYDSTPTKVFEITAGGALIKSVTGLGGSTDFDLSNGLGLITLVPGSGLIEMESSIDLQNDMSLGGDIYASATSTIYLGASGTDGSWKIVRSGNDLVFQRRESSVWVTKGTFAA